MVTSPCPNLPPPPVTPLFQPERVFSLKQILVVGAVGVVVSAALYSHLQKPFKSPPSPINDKCVHLPLHKGKIFLQSVMGGLGAMALIMVATHVHTLIKNSSSAPLGTRLIRLTAYSAVAFVGIAAILFIGIKIFTTFFKIEIISLHPIKVSISRHKTIPKPPPSTTSVNLIPPLGPIPGLIDSEEQLLAWLGLPNKPPAPLPKPLRKPPQMNENQPMIEKFPLTEGTSELLPFDILTKSIFPAVLKDEPNFNMFYRIALVSKSWRHSLYSSACLVPESRTHFLSKAFSKTEFKREDFNAFFNRYLPPKEQYEGAGLLFSWGEFSLSSPITLKELNYLAGRFPLGSFDSLPLLVREGDDAKQAGVDLSVFLKKGTITSLDILHEEKSTTMPILSQVAEKIVQLLQHTQGRVPSLVIRGGWNDPSHCQNAMQNLKVTNLYFLAAERCSPKGASFEGEELKKLSILQVREGTLVTNTLKMTPQLTTLSILYEGCRKIHPEDDPLRGLSLENVQLEKLEIDVCQSNIQTGELKTLLKTQTCLKDLLLVLPRFVLLSTTFKGLPIESLVLTCEDGSCDEPALAEALSSLQPTLKTLELKRMAFTGNCLKSIQLQELTLIEIEQLQDDALHQALIGHHLKKLFLCDVDITEFCLKGLEVEGLTLAGCIPRLNEVDLYETLVGMKERGLKTLRICCYRGHGNVYYNDGYKNYTQEDHYLDVFKTRLKRDEIFAEVAIY